MNLGSDDRIIRIIIALIISYTTFSSNMGNDVLAVILYVVSGVLLLTSFIGKCPLYHILKIRTFKT